MTTIALILTLIFPGHAFAGVDKPGQEPSDGGGELSDAAVLLALAGAAYMIYQGVKHGDSIGNIVQGAVLGLSFGAMIGLPIGCMLK